MLSSVRRRFSRLLIGGGAALMLTAAVLIALTATGVLGDADGKSGPGTVTGFGSVLSVAPPASSPSPAPPVSTAPLDRILIPGAKVDAPIVVKGLDANRVMQSPDNADDVAWYDFTSRPGQGSNAVFSGHVDYVKVGPAVFWNLNDLNAGDGIEIRYTDGTSVFYEVTAVNTFDAATAPIDEIVGPTAGDAVTLITCAGSFNGATRQYDQRLIVRAEKV